MKTVIQQKRTASLNLGFNVSDYGPVLALLLLIIIGSILSPAFMTTGNIYNILIQISVLGLGAIGLTYVMISGYLDLSIAGILSLNSVIAVGLVSSFGATLSIASVLLIGVLIGLGNGLILNLIKGDFGTSIMITFGTGSIFSALALMYTGGFSLTLKHDPIYNWFGQGKVLSLPAPAIIFLVCAVVLHIILKYTTFGRAIYLTGANPEAARLSGINIFRIRTIAFMIVGLLVTLGALVQTSQTVNASPVSGAGYELDVIAAVAIGGTSLTGGEGNIVRTIIGVLIIGVLGNLFILLGFNSFIQMIAKGLIIIAALLMDKRKETKVTSKGLGI